MVTRNTGGSGISFGHSSPLFSAGTWTADQTFNDNVNITLGTGGDVDLFYDGNDTYLENVVGSGGVMIGLGTSPPAPDGDGVHIWRATAGSVTASTNGDELILENSTHGGMSILTPNSAYGLIYFGDPDANNAASFAYNHGGPRFEYAFEGSNRLFYSAGAFAFQEATTISTSSSDLTISAASQAIVTTNLLLRSDSTFLYLGAGDDATLRYNGTNLLINPKVEGSGFANVTGTLVVDDALGIGTTPDAANAIDIDVDKTSGSSGDSFIKVRGTYTSGTNHTNIGLDFNVGFVRGGTIGSIDGALFRSFEVAGSGTTVLASTVRISGAPTTATGTNTAAYALYVNQDDVWLGGDLVMGTSGKGIDFSATSDAGGATSELLDDYEEGTWTPALGFVTAGNQSIAYTTQVGLYTKVGRLVHVTFSIITSGFTHSSASGNLQLTGIPFDIHAQSNVRQSGVLSRVSGWTKADFTAVGLYGDTNATHFLFGASGSGQAAVLMNEGDWPTGGSLVMHGSMTYETDA